VRIADPARGPRRVGREEFLEKWSGYAALFRPTPALQSAPEAKPSVRWMWQFLADERRVLAVAIVLALAAAALQLLVPIMAQVIVDDVVPDDDLARLNVLIVALLGALVAMTLATLLQRYLLSRSAVRIDRRSLDFLTGRLLALPFGYFAARRTGDIERRLAGMQDVRRLIVQDGVQALTALTQIAAVLTLMFVYSPKLALTFLATAPLYAALMRFSVRRLRPTYADLEQSLAEYHAGQIDAIKGIETVKATGAEGTLQRYMLRQFDVLGRRTFKADFTIMLYEGAVQLVGFLGFALFLWVGGREVVQGDLSIGELVAFNALVALATAPILMLMTAWDELQVTNVLLTRLNDVVDQEPEQGPDRARLRPVTTLSGHVSFRSLGFSYPGPVPIQILEGLNLDVEPGTTVAVVGRSGSGKTTLARLLAGLLEPTEGRLLYDGFDVTGLDYASLRRNVGVVLQESYLFDTTITRNIALTADEPDLDAVIWAARMANAHAFVEQLPLGYETKVGESGIHLSGGQAQRIAIARALYNRPPVLIFDEATSALDAESERAVKDNMDELLSGRTAFVIAHRLSTVRDADMIVVLDRGRIVECGAHDELMARQGLYYYLVSQQLDF
jgi:ATP-binding cassette subfamily B protein